MSNTQYLKPNTQYPTPKTQHPTPNTQNPIPKTQYPTPKKTSMGNFQNLTVWQRAKDLAVNIYKMTAAGMFASDYGLRDQIRRASVSIPSNIAEGDENGSNKQAVRFFNIAKGSNAEVLTQAIIASEIGYITKEQFENIQNQCNIIGKMLTKLIQARK